MAVVLGIDLGTTNSVLATRDAHGRPRVLADRDGRSLIPSMLHFGSDPPAVGRDAEAFARLGDGLVASRFKPQLGHPHWGVAFGGRTYTATDLSALLLAHLKTEAEVRLGQAVDRAVITVPAYFGDPQRLATLDAARQAGLQVLRLLNEPTAAVLAYGLQRPGVDETVLVYDLGGGTFDVTVARITPEAVTVLATAGDHDLGGQRWDDRIAAHLGEQFAAATGLDPLDDPLMLHEVLQRSEQAKWALSERSATRVTLQFEGLSQSFELTRADFEGMTAPLLDRTRRLTEEALTAAGLDWPYLSGVLLVGGSTRMPMVRSFVTELSGRPPRAGVNVDEVVALGAAVQAAADLGEPLENAVPRHTLGSASRPALPRPIHDVMSQSLGVVAVSDDGNSYLNDVLIPRNQPIPAVQTRSYHHMVRGEADDWIDVYLTQGESANPADCMILGRYRVRGWSPTVAAVTVELSLAYDASGVVVVTARDRDSGQPLTVEVESIPDDLSWLDRPPTSDPRAARPDEPIVVYLLIDVSASMAGAPLLEAQEAARTFLERCDFTRTQVGLIAFSDTVVAQADATSNVRRILAAIERLEAESTTNLSDALTLAVERLSGAAGSRYLVVLTDGFPDAPEDAVRQAAAARAGGIQVVAIGTGVADLDYLKRLATTEAGAIFAPPGALVQTFGRIARRIAEGGRGLRILG